MLAFLRLLRPHQWLKNSFVFAGILFAHQWNDSWLLTQAVILAIAFSLLASSMYIVNDRLDIHYDAAHPYKKNRPLASGQVSINNALILALGLAAAAFALGCAISLSVVIFFGCYTVLNISYSLWLKNILYLDVLVIATGFLLRILAGTVGLGIQPSAWILICGFCLTLFLALMKRRTEQKILTHYTNAISQLPNYNIKILNILLAGTACVALLTYSFYSLQHHVLLTIPLVGLGIFRYGYLCYQSNSHGLDIAKDFLSDPYLVSILLLWLYLVHGTSYSN